MTREEQLKRYKLQLEGLADWPPDDIRTAMENWVLKQIKKLQVQ